MSDSEISILPHRIGDLEIYYYVIAYDNPLPHRIGDLESLQVAAQLDWQLPHRIGDLEIRDRSPYLL